VEVAQEVRLRPPSGKYKTLEISSADPEQALYSTCSSTQQGFPDGSRSMSLEETKIGERTERSRGRAVGRGQYREHNTAVKYYFFSFFTS
jgi:hypothetical protein